MRDINYKDFVRFTDELEHKALAEGYTPTLEDMRDYLELCDLSERNKELSYKDRIPFTFKEVMNRNVYELEKLVYTLVDRWYTFQLLQLNKRQSQLSRYVLMKGLADGIPFFERGETDKKLKQLAEKFSPAQLAVTKKIEDEFWMEFRKTLGEEK